MTTEPRPPAQFAGAIAELAQLDQWVISKYVTRGDKLDKPPFSPLLDAKHTKPWQCSHSNPAHWAGYDAAFSTLTHYRFLWMGFVFHESDPYSGVDLDGCCKPECECIRTCDDIEDWALRIIDLVNSYTEISPSGKGVKIFARGALGEALLHSLGAHKGLEVYSKQRYFTVTGAHLAGTPSEICEAQAALDQLDREYRPARPAPQPATQQARTVISLKPRQQSGRVDYRETLTRIKQEICLLAELERRGCQIVGKRGENIDLSAMAGDSHDHKITYTLTRSTTGPGYIAKSKSPNGKMNNVDYPRGFDVVSLLADLDYCGDKTALMKAFNPIAPRKARQEAPPLVEQPARQQTPEQAADAERKRTQRALQAAETRAAVEQRAAADDRLTKSDKETLRAMLHWAAEHNSSACWLGRAAIAERSGYSLGSVKRSVMLLEQYGYFESSGEGGRPIDTAKRTFTRGSSFANANTFVVNDDPRIDITRDLPTRESIACERAPQPPATVEPAEWECWAATDAECSGYDLDLEAPPVVEPEQPALVELPAGWRIVRPARGPWCWAATEGAMTATHPRDTSDQVLIAAAWSKAAALAEVRAVEPVAIEKPQIAESVAPSSAPQEAAAGPGGWRKVVLGFDDSAQPELASFDGSGVPVPVAEPAPVPILVELDPLVQAPPIASEPTYLEFIWRYRAAQPGSIRKKTGAPWSNAQRARFKVEYQALLVDVSPEEAALRWAALQQPQARPSAPARAGVGDARPSQARRAAGPPLRAPGQQALLFGGAD